MSVTGVGGFPTRFYGTSAAAPHAAAIAALIKSSNPSLNQAQIRYALTKAAVDIQGFGWDRDSGAGIAMANGSLASLAKISSLTADKAAPQPAGTTITWTATATAGTAPLQYKWWVFDGTTWSVVRDWAIANTFAWTPAAVNANYVVGVWARSNGDPSDAWESYATAAFAIQPKVTAVSVAADKTSPQGTGTTITWTATATGGAAPLQYKWWIFDGTTWSVLRDWAAANTFAWTPATANANYVVGAWARSNGSTTDAPEAYGSAPFAIERVGVTGVTVAADKTAPQVTGTTITWTATATGGTAPLQYKWWVFDGVTWSVLRNWGASNTFAWTPATANASYAVGAWARGAGNTTDSPEAYGTAPFAIEPPAAPPPGVTVSVGADKIAPQPAGTTIVFTATASGGMAPLQYKWWLFDGSTWSVLRNWGTSNTFAWTPATANAGYLVGAWARSNGNTVDAPEAYASMPFEIQAPPPPPGGMTVTVGADKIAPQPVRTTITWTATASGGTAPLQYKWWIFDGTTWSVARDWGTSSLFAWTPATPNANYLVGVWVRSNLDMVDAPEAYASAPFAIEQTVTVAADRSAPQPAGTTITWTATANGGTAPLQYKWWIFDGLTWSVARDWDTVTTFAWMPAVANADYIVGVWVRGNGNMTDAPEVYASAPFAIQ